MRKLKIFAVLTTTLVILLASTTVVSATNGVTIGGQQVKPVVSNVTEIVSKGNKIIGLIQVVGTIIAVAMILVLGIKYMMGSSEEKAANKKSMLPYLIGAICLFIGSNLVGIIADWAKGW